MFFRFENNGIQSLFNLNKISKTNDWFSYAEYYCEKTSTQRVTVAAALDAQHLRG
jgi:hypothetical protein